ncbi:hypothetical protein MNBD_DELTA04-1428 [hydrothermal vent metagenome]|uniref:Uncharacterized protein n=1 Tax=hydrothermal vent metagenome TaxID=652676 RepID=A0A3B0V0X3_9ZZZZ
MQNEPGRKTKKAMEDKISHGYGLSIKTVT